MHPKTVTVSEGAYWVEIDENNNEISRIEKARLSTGACMQIGAIYKGELLREINGIPAGSIVGVETNRKSKFIIAHQGKELHIDAKPDVDFEFLIPIEIIDNSRVESEEDEDRQAMAYLLARTNKAEKDLQKHELVGVDLVAEMIAAQVVDIAPKNAQLEVFIDNAHGNNPDIVIFNDHRVLKYDRKDVRSLIKEGQMDGFIMKKNHLIDLLFAAMKARAALLNIKTPQNQRIGVAGEIDDVLSEINLI